ncbi:hypothetical protein [Spiroplasma endosymbiont of Diplazon laetatorius]|uniref:hypothetical protein n=1 Tax=Spiroplasma endosymbiont of Diplazon laetatorius TaxID=3066322 RepID=UPI0030D4B153
MKERFLSIGIDPAGIGKTGIIMKSFKSIYPKSWHVQIEANNPIEAFEKIISWIQETKKNTSVEDFEIKHVAVELLHNGEEKFREVKATRELIALLRYYFKRKFCGHYPKDKNLTKKKELLKKYGNKSNHWIDACCILQAHLNEENLNLRTQNYIWEEIKHGTKKSK